MPALPRTRSPRLKATVIALGGLYLFTAALGLGAPRGGLGCSLFALLFWVPLAIGLWRLQPWARAVSMGVHGVLFFLVPLGSMDWDGPLCRGGGSRIPPLAVFGLLWLIGAGNAWVIHVLGSHRHHFGSQGSLPDGAP